MVTVKLAVLTEHDLGDAMQLVSTANWNQTRQDWLRMVRLSPHGSFGAWLHNRLVGTITTTFYGKQLAWIGMMFVAVEYRRSGMATQLMHTAMEYLAARGAETIKLDATPLGEPLYTSLGFVPERVIERWEGIAQPDSLEVLSEPSEYSLPDLFSLDRNAFQADRSPVLETLLHDSCVMPMTVIASDGKLQGYALARQGTAARYLGPVVATDAQTALRLLDSMIGQLRGERLYIDVPATSDINSSALVQRGLVKQRSLMRMSFGDSSAAGTTPMLFASAGPELG